MAACTRPNVDPGGAVTGLISHLHRDHADAGALAAALAPGAAVHHPLSTEEGNLALAQAEHEFGVAKLARRAVATWESVTVGPFTCIALPAVDAALAGELLGAGTVVPMHYGGFAFEPHYRPVADAPERFVDSPETLGCPNLTGGATGG